MRKYGKIFGILLVADLLALLASLSVGATGVSLSQWWQGSLLPWQHSILFDLRLPRALAGFAVGGLLAAAGVFMQVLLRNPLAEPYVLGISGGASVAALATISAGLASVWVSGSAFLGAMLSMLLVFLLNAGKGQGQQDRLLLTGVVLAAGWGALTSLLLAIGPDQSLRGMLFWLLGDLSRAVQVLWVMPVLLAILAIGWVVGPALDLLTRGDEQAASMGVEVQRLRAICYIVASLLTACAVTLAGPIGFVGLVVPHLTRMLVGARHRILLPAALLAGGGMMMLADLLARSLIAPQQLPVGVLTAMIGVPLFLFLLRRQGSHAKSAN